MVSPSTSPKIVQRIDTAIVTKPTSNKQKRTGRYVPAPVSPQVPASKIEKAASIDAQTLNTKLHEILKALPLLTQNQTQEVENLLHKDVEEVIQYAQKKIGEVKNIHNLFQDSLQRLKKSNLEKDDLTKENNKNVEEIQRLNKTIETIKQDKNDLSQLIEQVKNLSSKYMNQIGSITTKNSENISDAEFGANIVVCLEATENYLNNLSKLLGFEAIDALATSRLRTQTEQEEITEKPTAVAQKNEEKVEPANINEVINDYEPAPVIDNVQEAKETEIHSDKQALMIAPKWTLKKLLELDNKLLEKFNSFEIKLKNGLVKLTTARNIEASEKEAKFNELSNEAKNLFKELYGYKQILNLAIPKLMSKVNQYFISDMHKETLEALSKISPKYNMDETQQNIAHHRQIIDKKINDLMLLIPHYLALTDKYLSFQTSIQFIQISNEQTFKTVKEIDTLNSTLFEESTETLHNQIFDFSVFLKADDLVPVLENEIVYYAAKRHFDSLNESLSTICSAARLERKNSLTEANILYRNFNKFKLELRLLQKKWDALQPYLKEINKKLQIKVKEGNSRIELSSSQALSMAISFGMPVQEVQNKIKQYDKDHGERKKQAVALEAAVNLLEENIVKFKKEINRIYDASYQGSFRYESTYDRFGAVDKDLQENLFSNIEI